MIEIAIEILRYLFPILIGLFSYFIISYFTEKGKNRAIKEDIKDITKKVEEAKSVYAKQLEGLKSSLASRLHVDQVRYKNEYKLLSELTEKLVDLRDATLRLRPVMEYVDQSEDDGKRKQRRLKAFEKAMVDLSKIRERKMPFYPETIYKKLTAFDVITWKEAIGYKNNTPDTDDNYWKNVEENSKDIESKATDLMKTIRERIQKWEDDKSN